MRGDAIEGIKFSLVRIETPGHATNHRAFALPRESALLSGDHVMAWPTAAAAAPDGALRPFMAAFEKLLARCDKIYWPGHGGPVEDPQCFVCALLQHRRTRETAILSRVEAGDSTTSRESQPDIFWNCTLLDLAARETGKFRLVRFRCNGCTYTFQFHRNVYIRCFLPFLFPYIVDSRRPFCLHIPGT
jgi:hypothetical protein